ncbi:hypothetical protein AAFF_G00380540 [Aldrovandia affinis]|uniref:PiggyBac transposable element-derived protein domain-containing protein n=1 Tax=Aldrovandia affinis TaxID=143900 RepID=A0AAD7T8T0_9TELE|nr:hypothetical protein AAFF_G00380540 [Aldrovandia affinis]
MRSLSTQTFYRKKQSVVVPAHPVISDDEGSEVEDNDVADPDFIPPTHNLDTPGQSDMGPSAKRKCVRPAVEVLEDEDEDNNYNDDEDQPASQAKRPTKQRKPAAIPTTWYFSPKVIEHITYQTNLYATQMDVNTTFTATEDEVMTFVAILIYMGISELPSIDDYWAMDTRVPQVANLMSSKRFKLMKRLVHFNDNTQIPGTIDRFFKIQPLFSFLNTAFKSEPQTPKQSVNEVMVAYEGKTAGNLRQYIKNKPDKWGFKLFARASVDGFIHDMVLYQGKTMLEAHGVPLTPEQNAMGATS